jgi:hypothetical protein
VTFLLLRVFLVLQEGLKDSRVESKVNKPCERYLLVFSKRLKADGNFNFVPLATAACLTSAG